MTIIVVVVDNMSVNVVVCKGLVVLECLGHFFMTGGAHRGHGVTLGRVDCKPSISRHEHGIIVNVPHNKDVEGDIVHNSRKGINCTQWFSCHMCVDHVSVHVPGSIPALLYQCGHKDTNLP